MEMYKEINVLRRSLPGLTLERHPLYKEFIRYTEQLSPNKDDMAHTLSELQTLNAKRKVLNKLK